MVAEHLGNAQRIADSTARALLGARSTDFRSTDFSRSLTFSSFAACAAHAAQCLCLIKLALSMHALTGATQSLCLPRQERG